MILRIVSTMSELTKVQIAPLVESKAVALRLAFGSQEAGFLTSFCPIAKAPTLIVIE